MEKKEITAYQIEIQTPVEIIDPRVTRYSVGKRFSKLYWSEQFQSWVAVSRQTSKEALIGPNNIKGVIFDAPTPKTAPIPQPNRPQRAPKPPEVA